MPKWPILGWHALQQKMDARKLTDLRVLHGQDFRNRRLPGKSVASNFVPNMWFFESKHQKLIIRGLLSKGA